MLATSCVGQAFDDALIEHLSPHSRLVPLRPRATLPCGLLSFHADCGPDYDDYT